MNTLPNLIHRLSQDSYNPYLNFDVAQEYLRLNQTASAVSFFLRCAEYGESDKQYKEIVYGSLCAIAKCFDDQKGREYSVTNALLQAIAFDDSRPEAYWLLANFHERLGNWQECYTFALLADSWNLEIEPLPIDLGYKPYAPEFQLAVSAYWIGRLGESINRFTKLTEMDLDPVYEQAVKDNLEKINALL